MISTSLALRQMLQEMDEALVDEIKKLQIDDRRRRHIVGDGILISDFNEQYIYDFSLEDSWEIADDTPVRIVFDVRQEVKGLVVYATGPKIRITTEQLLPSIALQKAYLVDDPTGLLEALRVALKSNDEGKAQLGSKSFGLKSFNSGICAIRKGTNEAFEPDSSQKKAIEMALGSEVTYIVGPPGTGKTSTLAAIAFEYLCAGRTVLVAAHTNIAVDNAVIRLAKMCEENKNSIANREKKAGHIIRFGPPQLVTTLEKEYADVHLVSIVKQHSEALVRSKEKLDSLRRQLGLHIDEQEQKLVQIKQEQKKGKQDLVLRHNTYTNQLQIVQRREQVYQDTLKHRENEYIQQSDEAKQQLQMLTEQQGQLTQQQDQVQAEWSRCIAEIKVLEQRLMQAQKTSAIVRLLKHITSPKKLALELANIQQKRWSCEQFLIELQEQMASLYQKRATAENHLIQWNNALKAITVDRAAPSSEAQQIQGLQEVLIQIEADMKQIDASIQQTEHQLLPLKNQLQDIQKQIASLDAQLANIEKQVVGEARVIGTTLTKIYMNQLISSRRFDVVIMDEVSMASLPSVYVAASHADLSVVIIGDPQQLSPIKEAVTDVAKRWLGRSLFEMREVDLWAAIQHKNNSIILQEQSRMNPTIAYVAQRYIYDNLLKNSKRVMEGQEALRYSEVEPLPGVPLLLCDTSSAGPRSFNPEGTSRINVYHALCSIQLARQVFATLPEVELQEGQFRIGLITPYRKQERLLRKLVKDAGLEKAIRVGTVHRFQGLEAEVIIFDTVESPALPIWFTKGNNGSEAMKIINVAITRAQHKLILVANYQYILKELDEQNTLRQVVEAARGSKVVSSTSILSLPPFANVLLEATRKKFRLEYFTQDEFYEKFLQEVWNAQKELVIFSPFIGLQRTQMLIPLLEARIKSGLAISVVTSSTNQLNQKAEQQLQNIGIKIQKKKDMHEKLVFIDETILFIGSLNVLSHTSTSEIMVRVVAPESLGELKRFYGIGAVEKTPIKKGDNIELAYDEFPKKASTCKKCGQPLILKRRIKDQKPFYGCPAYHPTDKDHTSEDALYYHPRLTKLLCGGCGGPTAVLIKHGYAWIDCAAIPSCGYRQNIVYK